MKESMLDSIKVGFGWLVTTCKANPEIAVYVLLGLIAATLILAYWLRHERRLNAVVDLVADELGQVVSSRVKSLDTSIDNGMETLKKMSLETSTVRVRIADAKKVRGSLLSFARAKNIPL